MSVVPRLSPGACPRRLHAFGPSAALLSLATLIGSLLPGCLDHELPPGDDGEAPQVFIALQRDFADFRDWQAYDVESFQHEGVEGEVVVYLNRLPPRDAEEFPVGTILVKTVEMGDPEQWAVHAMVKRGGDFNASGALGWEYFDLGINDEDTPVILWRGFEPPGEGGYTVVPGLDRDETVEADCNGCHGAETENDHVLSELLRLSELS